MIKRYSILLSAFIISFCSYSATYFTRVNGNWNTPSTWSTTGCAGAAAATIPGAADNVIICAGRTVTMNGAPGNCLSITVNGTLNWTAANTTNVGAGGLILNNNATITGGTTGTLNVAGIMSVPAGATVTIARVNLNVTGTTTVSGTINFTNANGTKTFTNINMNSGSSIYSSADETYTINGNLSMTGATIDAANGQAEVFQVNGNLIINAGTSSFGVGGLTVTGTTTVTGTINWTDRTGAKVLNDVLITGTFRSSSNESFRINGNFTNNGTFIGGNRTYTFSGAGKIISGTSTTTMNRLRANGSVTLNSTLTVTNRLYGTGTYNQGSTGILNMTGATLTVTTFNVSAVGNIVNYAMGGAFTIRVPSDGSYSNLTVTNGTKSLAANIILNGSLLISPGTTFNTSNDDVTLTGNFTNNGTFSATTSIVTFNGVVPQTIDGTSTTAFNSVTLAANTFVNGNTNFSVGGTLDIGANATLAPAATVIVSGGGGTLTGTGTARVTRIAAVPDFLSQYTITTKVLGNMTVNYIGAGNQNVNAVNYGNLTISPNGARTVTMNPAIVGVSRVFTPDLTLTSYVITNNTVNYNGTIPQIITIFNYNHLTSSSTGTRTLPAAGTIGVAGVFTPGTNGYTVVNSTMNFNGTVAQTIPAFNFWNLTSSSTGARTLIAAGTIGIAGAFTPGINSYTITNNTVHFNGVFAQTIPAFTFFNMTVGAGVAIKSLGGNIIVSNNLLISGNLNVSPGSFSITVNRNWTNNGIFTPQLGTVTFSGAVAQTLSGTAITTFENLAIANTSGGVMLISGTYLLTGALLMSNGNFNANGRPFTMISTATKTARIGQITGTGSISGNFTIQRFLSTRVQDPVTSHWSDLASPVQASSMADWDTELFLSYPHSPPTTYSNVLAFSEPLDDYVAVTAGTMLTPGKGFEIALTDNGTLTSFTNTTLNTIGIPSQGTQNLSGLISFTPGCSNANLVGNPYASNIAWSTVFAASSGILSTYDEYDSNAGTYATFGLGNEIAQGQGFWVYTTSGAATLMVPENSKTTASNSSIRSFVPTPHLRLTLKGDEKRIPFSHTLKIGRTPTASDGYDTEDHPFRKSPLKEAPSITAKVGAKELSICTFTEGHDVYSIPLTTRTGTGGKYLIEVSGRDNFSEYTCIVLEDKLTGNITTLSEGSSIPVQFNTSDEAERFVLHFSKDTDCKTVLPSDTEDHISILANPEGNIIRFELQNETSVVIDVMNLLGQQLMEGRTLNVSNGTETIILPQEFSGMYLIRVSTPEKNIVQKFFRE